MQNVGKNACYAGNIGLPLSDIAGDIIEQKIDSNLIVVVEVSSFQLEKIRDYCSEVAYQLKKYYEAGYSQYEDYQDALETLKDCRDEDIINDRYWKQKHEEATEIVIAAKNPDAEELKYEISDLLYHMMVLMAEKSVTWKDVTDELADRR